MKRTLLFLVGLLTLTMAQAGTINKLSMRRASAAAPVLTSSNCWSGKETYDIVNDDRLNLFCFLRNYTDYNAAWDWGWACYDQTGQSVWIAQTGDNYGLDYGYGWDDSGCEVFFRGWEEAANRFEASGMADGTYTLKPVSRLTGSSEWHNNLGTDACYLTMVKSNNTLTITTTKVSASLTLIPSVKNATDGIIDNDHAVFGVHVENTGEIAYNDYIIVGVYKDRNDGTGYGDYVGEAAAMASVEAGMNADVEMSFDKIEDGASYFIIPYYKKGDDWQRGSDATPYFTVQMKSADLSLIPSIKFAKDGVVGTKTVTVSLNVTNNGSALYDNYVAIAAYKYRTDGSGYGDYATEAGAPIQLNAGSTADIELTLDDMEDGASYFIIAYYKSKGNWERGNKEMPEYTVQFNSASLQISPSVANANNDGVVEDTNVKLNCHVTNNGNAAYSNLIIAKVYKLRDDNSGYGDLVANLKEQISVNPGASKDVVLTFDKAEDGASYFYWCYYVSNGDEVVGAEHTPFFTFKYATAIDATTMATQSKAAAIYTLDGRLLTTTKSDALSQTLRQLPKGVYIVNGKKIRN